MSRSQFVETVTVPLGQSKGLLPVPGVAAIPYIINADGTQGNQSSAWPDRTNQVPLTGEELVTDDNGTIAFYLDDGIDYDVQFQDQQSPPRIRSFVRSFHIPTQVAPSSDGGGLPTGALLDVNNLSDVLNVASARGNLGLGDAAIKNASDFLEAISNGADIPNPTVFRSNIGAAAAGSGGSVAPSSGALMAANNLSDLQNDAQARANLGLGSAALYPAPFGGYVTVNFSNSTKSGGASTSGWNLARTPTAIALGIVGDYGRVVSPYVTNPNANGCTITCYSSATMTANVSVYFVVIP